MHPMQGLLTITTQSPAQGMRCTCHLTNAMHARAVGVRSRKEVKGESRHLAVQAARPQQRRVQRVRPVGRHQHLRQ